MNQLTNFLLDEQKARRKGGLYHKIQVQLAYNSNRIEGSLLTEEQTRYIFETRTIGFKDQDAVPVDDIIETNNHFIAFDFLLQSLNENLSETLIKNFHRILKTGTADAQKPFFAVGEYKKLPNEVGGKSTAAPADVPQKMQDLQLWYNSQKQISLSLLAEYHWRFESIHPFQDGNGRVGRLLLFRECLKHSIMPFIIDDRHKIYYYRGLAEFKHTPGFLIGTFQSAQDIFADYIKYFSEELLTDLRLE